MRSLALLTMISLPAWTPPAWAEALQDPTRPPEDWRPASAVATGGKAVAAAPKLTSILIGESRRIAIIDGASIPEGHSANGITVVRVGRTWVDATVGGSPMRLQLAGANVTKEPR